MIIDARSLVTNPEGNGAQSTIIGFAIHHSVGVNHIQSQSEELLTIRAIDFQHVNQDFGGFGYHYIVFPSGRAYWCGEGRRAHVAKRNHELRGIVLSGTWTRVVPGELQLSGLREVLLHERSRFGNKVIKGHIEWALPGEGTICPGMVVPRDWEAFMNQLIPDTDIDGWVVSHNQILAMQGDLVVVAIGDWEGQFPGRISKLFGNDWWWLRKGPNGEAFWSQEAGD